MSSDCKIFIRLTSWNNWQNKATKWSGAGWAAVRPDHLQTKDRFRPQNSQEQDWQQKDQTTHSLKAKQGHKMVKSSNDSRKIQSLTNWRQNKATKQSKAKLTTEKPGHLLPGGRTRSQNGQEQDCQQEDHTAYSLRAEWGHKMVRSMMGSRNTSSFTPWGQNKATKWLWSLAAERLDHLHTEGRIRPQNGQSQHQQQKGQDTYTLRAE